MKYLPVMEMGDMLAECEVGFDVWIVFVWSRCFVPHGGEEPEGSDG